MASYIDQFGNVFEYDKNTLFRNHILSLPLSHLLFLLSLSFPSPCALLSALLLFPSCIHLLSFDNTANTQLMHFGVNRTVKGRRSQGLNPSLLSLLAVLLSFPSGWPWRRRRRGYTLLFLSLLISLTYFYFDTK